MTQDYASARSAVLALMAERLPDGALDAVDAAVVVRDYHDAAEQTIATLTETLGELTESFPEGEAGMELAMTFGADAALTAARAALAMLAQVEKP